MSPLFHLDTREIPVKFHAGVAVCGGGPSGIMAAISVARHGVKVVLIEKQEILGGMATAGLVNPISEFNKNGHRIIGGIPWEFIERMHALGGANINAPSGNVHFDPEIYKLVAQRMLLEAGVTICLNTHLSNCIMEENSITHIIADSAGTVFAVSADCFVDCTGNADLCFLARVPFQPEAPGAELQPASLCFQMGGVDTGLLGKTCFQYQNTKYSNTDVRAVLESLANSETIPNFGGPWFASSVQKDTVTVNMTRIAADCTDPENTSRAMAKLREDVFCFIDVLKKHVPAFRSAWLMQSAVQLGCRESRRIQGLHTLTGEELLSGKYFKDTIACSAHPVDIHHAANSSQDATFLNEPGYIPYRSLVTEKYNNLIVAGRCISADRTAFASTRVQAPAMATGHAAGAAAALSCADNITFQQIEVNRLQDLLRSQNAIL
jgi:hypothetical protein